jgi:hypothetical protein
LMIENHRQDCMKSYRGILGRKSDFPFISNPVHIYINVSSGVPWGTARDCLHTLSVRRHRSWRPRGSSKAKHIQPSILHSACLWCPSNSPTFAAGRDFLDWPSRLRVGSGNLGSKAGVACVVTTGGSSWPPPLVIYPSCWDRHAGFPGLKSLWLIGPFQSQRSLPGTFLPSPFGPFLALNGR